MTPPPFYQQNTVTRPLVKTEHCHTATSQDRTLTRSLVKTEHCHTATSQDSVRTSSNCIKLNRCAGSLDNNVETNYGLLDFFVPNDPKNALPRSGHYVDEHSVYKCDFSLGLWNIQIVTGWCSGNGVIRILDTFGAYHGCFIASRD